MLQLLQTCSCHTVRNSESVGSCARANFGFSLSCSIGVWRDKIVFTWDYRTFNFKDKIEQAARDLIPNTPCTNFKFLKPEPSIVRPYPDLAYLQFSITFDTHLANASAVINAVKTADGWKIWTMHSVIEGLLNYPEVPPQDGHMTGENSWELQRELDDSSVEPEVLIVGGGQK